MQAYASVFLLSLVFIGTAIKFQDEQLSQQHSLAFAQQIPLADNDDGENKTEASPHRGSGR